MISKVDLFKSWRKNLMPQFSYMQNAHTKNFTYYTKIGNDPIRDHVYFVRLCISGPLLLLYENMSVEIPHNNNLCIIVHKRNVYTFPFPILNQMVHWFLHIIISGIICGNPALHMMSSYYIYMYAMYALKRETISNWRHDNII